MDDDRNKERKKSKEMKRDGLMTVRGCEGRKRKGGREGKEGITIFY